MGSRVNMAPDELQRLVLEAVAPYVDRAVLAQRITQEEQQRRALREFIGRWGPGDGTGGRR
ncbi:hypothetical protein ACIQVO_37035 [Streptomyces sp. NPDC101062]|uniref:hypothetical protein n=1 Tax=unclassified Streptomyces TaxID=2593676 RepID=UPI00380C61AD